MRCSARRNERALRRGLQHGAVSGALNSTERTAEQTEIARFYTENPTTFWTRNLRDFAATRALSVDKSARLFAMLYVAFADSSIACWDSKYYFNFWRPVTAIAVAATDDNPCDPGGCSVGSAREHATASGVPGGTRLRRRRRCRDAAAVLRHQAPRHDLHQHGAIVGRQVGRYIAKNYFEPVKR